MMFYKFKKCALYKLSPWDKTYGLMEIIFVSNCTFMFHIISTERHTCYLIPSLNTGHFLPKEKIQNMKMNSVFLLGDFH